MAKRIAIASYKGGVRKSAIAVPYARLKQVPYYTTDKHFALAKCLLSTEQIVFMTGKVATPTEGIFDLAGATDDELIKLLLNHVDLWVFPLSPSVQDNLPTLSMINSLFQGYENKIVFVITGVKKEEKEYIELSESLKKSFPNISTFSIRNSKYARDMIPNKTSILEYEGLAKHHTQGIKKDYTELYNFMDNF